MACVSGSVGGVVELKPVRLQDREELFRWREETEGTAPWYGGRPVSHRQHERWLRARVRNPAVEFYIGVQDGRHVGQVRVDSDGEISFSVDARYRGNGYAARMVALAAKLTQHDRLKASVDHDNVPGASTLLVSGFEHRPDVDFYLWKR